MRIELMLGAFVLGGLAGGCAGWTGEIPAIPVRPAYFTSNPIPRTPAPLLVEKVEVADHDDDRDFTPIAERYAVDLQRRLAEYICARNAFARCTTEPVEGAYRLKIAVEVQNYRQAQGGWGVALGCGLLVPPLLGLAWALPVGMGSCSLRARMTLLSPAGEKVWEGEPWLGSGSGFCVSGRGYAFDILPFVEGVLSPLTKAAFALEEEGTRARTARMAGEAETAADTTGKREVLAVFDVQDVAGRFAGRAEELVQLTTFLATAMATTGRFTVVPREQLRDRLVDEKRASYRPCFDSACQIELGKAVAAEKTLATQLIQVGAECAVVANLYDLRSETASTAAMVQTPCEGARLLDALKQVAEQIAKLAK